MKILHHYISRITFVVYDQYIIQYLLIKFVNLLFTAGICYFANNIMILQNNRL